MKVIFTTNIDAYSTKRCFPEHMIDVPRKGDFICVKPEFESYFRDLKFPTRLEVVSVTWSEHEIHARQWETTVYCELWFKDTDFQIGKLNGINLL